MRERLGESLDPRYQLGVAHPLVVLLRPENQSAEGASIGDQRFAMTSISWSLLMSTRFSRAARSKCSASAFPADRDQSHE